VVGGNVCPQDDSQKCCPDNTSHLGLDSVPSVMLREIRALPAALERVAGALEALLERQIESGPAEARLEELERSRARWEAEIEALLLRADSTLKAANNAESRSRTMKRNYEKLFGELDPDRVEELEIEARRELQDRDVEAVADQGVLELPVGVAADHKAWATRLKFS